MGVYINMEMPTSCDECILNNGITCYAVPDYKEDGVVGRTDDRPDWCPLVPVPPHGRLIEENKVLDIVSAWCPDDDGSVGKVGDLREMLDEIEALPTIIPAEEGE